MANVVVCVKSCFWSSADHTEYKIKSSSKIQVANASTVYLLTTNAKKYYVHEIGTVSITDITFFGWPLRKICQNKSFFLAVCFPIRTKPEIENMQVWENSYSGIV